jgi:hypothetical protein
MFPPMSPQTERVRAELENRQIEERAALNARLTGYKTGSIISVLAARLLSPLRRQNKQTHLKTGEMKAAPRATNKPVNPAV